MSPQPRRAVLESEDYEIELFGERLCPSCGKVYAANTDYFAPDVTRSCGLTTQCRNCRRERDRTRPRR